MARIEGPNYFYSDTLPEQYRRKKAAELREAILDRGVLMLVTGNPNKSQETEAICRSLGLDVTVDLRKIGGLLEIQGTREEIAAKKALAAGQRRGEIYIPQDAAYGNLPIIPVVEDTNMGPDLYGGSQYIAEVMRGNMSYKPAGMDDETFGCQRLVWMANGIMVNGINDRRATATTIFAIPLDRDHAILFGGEVHGRIATEVRPPTYGFSWDRVFIPDGFDQTFSEMPPEVKNRTYDPISMRVKALMQLRDFLDPPVDHVPDAEIVSV